jgi:metal-responsive CopG/Arc/MetJ family transcriptional regulator
MVKISVTFRLDQDLLKKIDEYRAKKGIKDRTAAVEMIIRSGLPSETKDTQDEGELSARYLQLRYDGKNPIETAIILNLTQEQEKNFSSYFDQMSKKNLPPQLSKAIERTRKPFLQAITEVFFNLNIRIRRGQRREERLKLEIKGLTEIPYYDHNIQDSKSITSGSVDLGLPSDEIPTDEEVNQAWKRLVIYNYRRNKQRDRSCR